MVFTTPTNGWKIEYVHSSDVGNHYCVNPYLYSVMSDFLEHQTGSVTMADIGAGTCTLAQDFLQGASYLPSFLNEKIRKISGKVEQFVCLEQDPSLLFAEANSLPTIKKVEHVCSKLDTLPLMDNSIDLVTSRHFIMHLDSTSFIRHINEVSRVLKPGGKYLMVSLTPEYEQKKFGSTLTNGQKYLFPKSRGPVEQHFKTDAFIKSIVSQKLIITQKLICSPIIGSYKQSHPQYYDPAAPMAQLYILTK